MERKEIRDWVKDNAYGLMPTVDFNDEDFDHIAMCMEHISLWYFEGYPIGDFLTAVVRNDFMNASLLADNVNQKSLYLYALFMANKIPADYRTKAGLQALANDTKGEE